MKKLLLIVNPCSGRARVKNYLLSIVKILSGAGYEVVVYPTKCPADATVRASAVKQGEFDRIVVCGGDGTLNEVISGLMISGVKCNIGYIPLGTLNEWSSGLNISRDVKTAAKDSVGETSVQLDIGKFGERYFTYTASFGAFTEVSYSAPQDAKNVLGQAAYFFEGVKSLGNIKAVHLKFEADDRTVEGDFLFGAVSNSFSVGGIVKFNQNLVELNDGIFEVLLIRKPKNIAKLQTVVDGILRHDLNCEGMEFFHTKSIKVIGGKNVPWTLDGEYAPGEENLTISTIHSAINFIVPKTEI